jgi:hypothetical protein
MAHMYGNWERKLKVNGSIFVRESLSRIEGERLGQKLSEKVSLKN